MLAFDIYLFDYSVLSYEQQELKTFKLMKFRDEVLCQLDG